MLDELIEDTFSKKQSLGNINQELLDTYLTSFAEKVSYVKQMRKQQKILIEQLSKINETNKELEQRNQNLDRDLLQETQRQVEKKIELEQMKDTLLNAQFKVSQICFIESKEISQLQDQRDRRLEGYDKTINKLAQKKAQMSTDKIIKNQTSVNQNLRMLMKSSKETKSQVEFKAA